MKAHMDEEVETLRFRAQTALGVGKGRLINSSGVVLDVTAAIKDSGVRNGDSLTLHINRAKASATAGAFAVVLGDGSVAAGRDAHHGGNVGAVQVQTVGQTWRTRTRASDNIEAFSIRPSAIRIHGAPSTCLCMFC